MVCEIYPDETSEFWKVAGHHAGGDEADSDHRLPPARRRLRRKGRHLRQFRALAAVEERRGPAARRLPGSIRKSWRASSCEVASSVCEGRRQISRSDPERRPGTIPIPTIRRSRKSRVRSTARRWPTWRSVDQAADQSRPAAARFSLLAGRRQTSCGNWLYCGLVDRGGRHDAAARHRRSIRPGHLSRTGDGPGRPTAASSTTARPAISKASPGTRAQTDLVERSPAELGGQRRPRFQSRFAAQGTHGPVHHESRRRRAHLCAARRLRRRTISRHFTSHSRARSRIRCIPSRSTIRW